MEKPSALWRRLTIFAENGPSVCICRGFPVLTRPALKAIYAWCRKNGAKLNAGVNYVIMKIRTRIGEFHAAASKIP